MSTAPKYPDVHVELVGQDGNAFAILARVSRAMKQAKVPAEDQSAFQAEATSGDYDHLLRTVTKWVSVGVSDDDDEYDED